MRICRSELDPCISPIPPLSSLKAHHHSVTEAIGVVEQTQAGRPKQALLAEVCLTVRSILLENSNNCSLEPVECTPWNVPSQKGF